MHKRPRDFIFIDAIISENDDIIGTAQGVADFTSASNDFNARIKKKLEFSAADTEPITNLCREGKALQIETVDKDSEFTESESLFDYEKSKSSASSTLNYFSWVIYSYIVAVTCLGDAPKSDLTFNVFKPHII